MLPVLIAAGVVALLAIYLAALYNTVVRLRNRIDNAWAQIDVQLRRRYDLIPNLVETVKAYAAHEQATLERVVAARNLGISAANVHDQAAAESEIGRALKGLLALSEAYPDLKGNQSFLALQEELTGTEGRIAYARQFYNDTVLRYNTRIQSFPAVLLARSMGLQPREYFDLDGDATARGPVQVDF